jgi:hypothetical protein
MITKALVKNILEKATSYKWSLQGFGMLRLYLSKDVRMHVWHPDFAVKKVSHDPHAPMGLYISCDRWFCNKSQVSASGNDRHLHSP